MASRRCPCGKRIPLHQSVCAACADKYGTDRAAWPEWLRFCVRDTQRELDCDRRHDELTVFDDDPVDDRYPSELPNNVRAAWSYIARNMLYGEPGDG
jgi:hypothetical protein